MSVRREPTPFARERFLVSRKWKENCKVNEPLDAKQKRKLSRKTQVQLKTLLRLEKTTKPPTPKRESERKEISAGRQETYVLRTAGQARPGCDHSGVVRAPSKAHLVAREGSRVWDGEWRGEGASNLTHIWAYETDKNRKWEHKTRTACVYL